MSKSRTNRKRTISQTLKHELIPILAKTKHNGITLPKNIVDSFDDFDPVAIIKRNNILEKDSIYIARIIPHQNNSDYVHIDPFVIKNKISKSEFNSLQTNHDKQKWNILTMFDEHFLQGNCTNHSSAKNIPKMLSQQHSSIFDYKDTCDLPKEITPNSFDIHLVKDRLKSLYIMNDSIKTRFVDLNLSLFELALNGWYRDPALSQQSTSKGICTMILACSSCLMLKSDWTKNDVIFNYHKHNCTYNNFYMKFFSEAYNHMKSYNTKHYYFMQYFMFKFIGIVDNIDQKVSPKPHLNRPHASAKHTKYVSNKLIKLEKKVNMIYTGLKRIETILSKNNDYCAGNTSDSCSGEINCKYLLCSIFVALSALLT